MSPPDLEEAFPSRPIAVLGTASPSSSVPPNEIFRALADPTRCQVVERLSRSRASVSELAAPFDMALPSFMQHLRLLEKVGLVVSEKRGRVRAYALVPKRLALVEDWLARQRSLWEKRLDQLDQYLLEMKKEQQ